LKGVCILNDLARFELMNELLLLIRKNYQDSLDRRFETLQSSEPRTHGSHDLYMSQNAISSEVNKAICEAVGCFAEAKWHHTENSSYEQQYVKEGLIDEQS
jgi:hypothetical protein